MSLRIKAVVDKFVQELQEALEVDIQDRIRKDREMQSYIVEREREVADVKLLGRLIFLAVRLRLLVRKQG
ncbi:hypothetical protein PHAVU_010G144400 [Phaseolus vulgaris]|uniref:Uncharacterized protein n=1 Tax=Phaseolus vulgaris TaxID=3885 RepID=V7ATT1_PHAVU|nr:hypothetical protein PHAVU_010G144400g [Phaseolus vulgaris]XP_007135623.1 hypothetical protein PHAVU_010G144400g [Phaseolus vulgaris]ESW07616.1 hypothetical protein PHAVU_010G144400g [Phaseolus vulgaris]ESW07617.1 hypothetical protein PHAVU_010G144400g [Phaseolus vulgaris]